MTKNNPDEPDEKFLRAALAEDMRSEGWTVYEEVRISAHCHRDMTVTQWSLKSWSS